MATKYRKLKFYWCLPILFFVSLNISALADQEEDDYSFLGIQESGYQIAEGDSFFMMADSGFSSGGKAVIRLEGPEVQMDRYTGVDIVLYRIPDPVNFLKKQPDLHRVRIPGKYEGEGLANAMNYVWDVWYKKSRLAWQRIFSPDARTKATAQAPLLKQTPPHTYRTEFEDNPQFKPIPGLPMVNRFRYPLNQAKPIQPPKEVRVEGSSNEFIPTREGNVLVPLGVLSPGLYLVEGLLGPYRAVTLVFVSDTAAITKTSGAQMMVWTADKKTGHPAITKLLLTDGAGTLESGVTGSDGVAFFNRKSPERSYLIAEDKEGGVYVSENFYYDSEIHNAKLFAFTDRPIYRPGDNVQFKLVGRNFINAQESKPLESGPIRVLALDSRGAPVASTIFHLDSKEGGDGSFRLPDNAPAGGYTLRMAYKDEPYAASFRVARYAKPHYDINITFDRKKFVTGEEVSGVIRASWPGGQPVKELPLELSLRSQILAMSDYELRQRGRFPVTLTQESLVTDNDGSVHFTLPAAQDPSRYTLRVVGTDDSAYRVSAIRDLLIDPGIAAFTIETEKKLSKPGERVLFHFHKNPSPEGRPVAWEALRLEDQSIIRGDLVKKDEFSVSFEKAGSYTVRLMDDKDRIVGSLPHWVGGDGLQNAPDTITILIDKEKYRMGDSVHALICFPQPVDEALLTLERDSVHHYGLLSKGADWLSLTRKSDTQWEAEIPITPIFPPNLAFSVLMMKDGTFLFQNKGIRVEDEPVSIAMTPDKSVYLPGDKVTVNLFTSIEGKGAAADLAVSVVDEMVYVLQPELAPDIRDFFGHVRRNQVRTLSSLNFHTYDQAINAGDTETPERFNRPIKLLERPRRENIDTAAWFPRLKTDKDGKGSFSFVMPDSLTRWRITARATTPAGRMGQNVATLISEKPAYLKWTGPKLFRENDRIEATIIAFNTGDKSIPSSLSVHTASEEGSFERALILMPGANYFTVPLRIHPDKSGQSGQSAQSGQSGQSGQSAQSGQSGQSGQYLEADKFIEVIEALDATLKINNSVVDRISIPISVVPSAWPETGSITVPLTDKATRVAIPEGAREIRASIACGAEAQWLRVAADLVEYPYGCAEQTASRLIPLSLAYRSMRSQSLNSGLNSGLAKGIVSGLHDRVANERFRLAQMAGPEAGFAWWGDQAKGSPFFSAYAYFADNLALSALGIEAPSDHWMKLLDIYSKGAKEESILLRTLSLWLADEMHLPVRTMALGVAKDLMHSSINTINGSAKRNEHHLNDSLILGSFSSSFSSSAAAGYLSMTLLDLLIKEDGKHISGWQEAMQQAHKKLEGESSFLLQAAALMAQARITGKISDEKNVAEILSGVSQNAPTIDRSLALIFLYRALGGSNPCTQPGLKAPWVRQENLMGQVEWIYPDAAHGEVIIQPDSLDPDRLEPDSLKPHSLEPDSSPSPGANVTISYQSFATTTNRSSIAINRTLYRLVPAEEAPEPDYWSDEPQIEHLYKAIEVAENEPLDATALYLDEVTLDPGKGRYKYGLLEVPLPPGAELDPFVWGMAVEGVKESTEPLFLPETHAQMRDESYAVPVGSLSGDAKTRKRSFRHLVRFPQRGVMNLPPTRYFSMYNPEEVSEQQTGVTTMVVK